MEEETLDLEKNQVTGTSILINLKSEEIKKSYTSLPKTKIGTKLDFYFI